MQEVYECRHLLPSYRRGGSASRAALVRPFGTVDIFEGRLYIQTGKVKDVSKQLWKNPKAELCAFDGERWPRVSGEPVRNDRWRPRRICCGVS